MATKRKGGPSRSQAERRERTGTVVLSATVPVLHEAMAAALARRLKCSRSAVVAEAVRRYYADEIGDTAPWEVV